MGVLKDQVKDILNSLGYSIHKNPTEASELLDFYYKNDWLRTYGINTVLDIGANEGQFAKKISHLFPKAALHCFEPLNEPFIQLKENLRSNKNAILYQFALGETEENLAINLNEFSPSSSFLKLEQNHEVNFAYAVTTQSRIVQVKKLDGLDLKLINPVLIKIDVQGFEDKVIAGGKDTIKKAQIIIIEVTFKELYADQPLFNDIYGMLSQLGFKYHGNFEQLPSPVTGEILQADAIFIK